MANICDNEIHVFCSKENGDVFNKFLEDHFDCDIYEDSMNDDGTRCIEAYFSSRWSFPEDLMTKMLDDLVDDKFEATCLSTEWGCLYCRFSCSDGTNWTDEG